MSPFFVWVKKGRVKKYFISCAVSGTKIFLAGKNLRYEKSETLSEPQASLALISHAFSRFLAA